ncbi:hypothetical protein D3C76_1780500 [compost metagenome]
MGVGRKHQHVTGSRVDRQCREVAQVQFIADMDLLVALEQLAAIAFPGKQRRRAFLSERQLLVAWIPGDAFEPFVLVF